MNIRQVAVFKDEKERKGDHTMASITINTNLASLTAQRNLSAATSGMNTAMERLSTGFRINSGADDAAGSAVSTLMEAQISAYDVAESNATMGLSLLDTAEGILGIVGDYLQRIRDLTEQAANGTYGTSSMNAIRTEVQQRMLEINRLCEVIDFNGIKLLDGTSWAYTSNAGVNLQVSNNSGRPNIINLESSLFASAKCTALFITGEGRTNSEWYLRDGQTAGDANTMEFLTPALYARITGTAVELPNGTTYDYSHMEAIVNKTYDQYDSGTPETGVVNCITAICDAVYTDDSTAREFLQFIDDAIENVSDRTTLIGAYMNRVNSAVDAIDVQKENIVSANSSIKDADIAEESSNYIKYQILQQSTATLLSTANQTPSIALNLI